MPVLKTGVGFDLKALYQMIVVRPTLDALKDASLEPEHVSETEFKGQSHIHWL